MTKEYKNATCRGSYILGTACGKCERCADDAAGLITAGPDKRKEENKKANAEVTKLVDSIVNQPPKPAVVDQDLSKLKPDQVVSLKEELIFATQPGTTVMVPAYEQEISAIGVLLRNLAPLDHETRTRVLSYAMQWVDDQKGQP